MEITVNIVELASELAEKKIFETIMHTTGCTIEEAKQEAFEEVGNETRYTEEAQDEFDYWYDEYYEIIFKCKSSDYGNN